MKSDEPERAKSVLLESNPPREAAQLLKRFDISVDSAWASEVAQIHRDLVGDGLPNYDSSFFRDHRNV